MTRRTILVSVLLVAVVTAVIGALTVAIDRQHDSAQRARRSLSVVAAANLAQQRFLSVQTNIRGYLIRGNEDLLSDYRIARAALPDAAFDLQDLVAGDREQSRRAALIREEVQSYVNDYADPVIGRTREDGVNAGRDFATANDGIARGESIQAHLEELAEAERTRSASSAAEADEWSDRALTIAIGGLIVLVLVLVLVRMQRAAPPRSCAVRRRCPAAARCTRAGRRPPPGPRTARRPRRTRGPGPRAGPGRRTGRARAAAPPRSRGR